MQSQHFWQPILRQNTTFYMYMMPYTEDKHATLFIITDSWEHDEKNQLTEGSTCSSKKKEKKKGRHGKDLISNERSPGYGFLKEERRWNPCGEHAFSLRPRVEGKRVWECARWDDTKTQDANGDRSCNFLNASCLILLTLKSRVLHN